MTEGYDSEALRRALQAALDFGEVNLVVRSSGAIAEIHDISEVRTGKRWLNLGHEGQSHVHLNPQEVSAVRLSAPEDRNLALEVLATDGEPVLRVAFRGTNPASAEKFDGARRQAILDALAPGT